MPVVRRLSLILGTLAVLLMSVAPASAQTQVVIEEVRVAVEERSTALLTSPGPCQDGAFRLLGGRWTRTYEWSFKRSSTPSGLDRAAVTNTLTRSFDNVTNARNDCGRQDNVSATHDYLGVTTRSPNCRSRDGYNVVGFGRMDLGVLAVTCFWMSNGRIIEADMRINDRESWSLAMNGCQGDRLMLEATITHEAGHVFGLDHVGERRHGRLTMSPYIDGPCNNNEATLGRGDMLGLEQIY
jgi:hypothetical protein